MIILCKFLKCVILSGKPCYKETLRKQKVSKRNLGCLGLSFLVEFFRWLSLGFFAFFFLVLFYFKIIQDNCFVGSISWGFFFFSLLCHGVTTVA